MPAFLPLLPAIAAGAGLFSVGALAGNKSKNKKNRMAGDNPGLFVDEYGVIRTLPGTLNQPGLKLDTSSGAAANLLDPTQGGQLIAPGSFYQTQRLLGLQQAADERAKLARLTEDDYKYTTQLEKDRATRLGQMVDFRQRVGTRGSLIQQGQLGNQELAQQAARNRGSVMAQTPQLS